MKGKSFFGLIKPQIVYPPISGAASPLSLEAPARATFLIPGAPLKQGESTLKKGDAVTAGQKLALADDAPGYAVSSICGVISSISPFTGNDGAEFTAVTVDGDGGTAKDDAWGAVCGEPTLETAAAYLDALPGAPDLARFLAPDHGIKTLVLLGVDGDLMVGTRQQILAGGSDALKRGIEVLKQITGLTEIVLAVPKDRLQGYGSLGAKVVAVGDTYPAALPRMVMKDVFRVVIPAQKTTEEMGVAFMSAEAAAAIGQAYESKALPTRKLVTVIGKGGEISFVEADLGTPVKALLDACGQQLNEKDRLILGGPMTGTAIYSELQPVGPDTDAVLLQDHADIAAVSDYPCTNCGECVRSCPVDIPINLLVRFLEAGAYEDAADLYDLHSCVDCGICSYICVSKIPIFQYIRLAKHELARTQAVEATHD